jgi:hypothetical protein
MPCLSHLPSFDHPNKIWTSHFEKGLITFLAKISWEHLPLLRIYIFLQRQGITARTEAGLLNAVHLKSLLKGPCSFNKTVSKVNWRSWHLADVRAKLHSSHTFWTQCVKSRYCCISLLWGIQKHNFGLRVPAAPAAVLTLEKAHSEPVSINTLKIRYPPVWCPTFQRNTKIFMMKY